MIEEMKPIGIQNVTDQSQPIRLTQTVAGAGWASKLAPGDLDKALCDLDIPRHPQVLVGLEGADDAGVYLVSDDLALIQTVDFFTPIVDDPYAFGQIAATNALSDIYAMGGEPKTALNLVAFPAGQMQMDVLQSVLQGGLDIMKRAEVALIGGHSVKDQELKYGLAVTGFVHPDHIVKNTGLNPGDQLILTKPIGTGIVNTAIKRNAAPPKVIDDVTRLMTALNREAAKVMIQFPVSACTDVTGYGLLGHLAEMIADAGVGVRVQASAIPLIPQTLDYVKSGFIPGGTSKNRSFRESMLRVVETVDPVMLDIMFDPQTSGGLLIGVPSDSSAELLSDLKETGIKGAAIIGEVLSDQVGSIVVE